MIEIRTLAPQPAAIIRTEARKSELPVVIPRLCGEVFAFAKAAGLAPGKMFALLREGTDALGIGVEIEGPFAGTERVEASSLPGGEVATAAHIGDYARLPETHQAIRRFCAERGLRLAGPFWDLYDHAAEDPAQQRTDVFYLLESQGMAGA